MLRKFKGRYSNRLAKRLSERGRRMAKARWDKWRSEPHPEPEPKMIRSTGLELGLRHAGGKDESWVEFKSVRDAARRLAVVMRYYVKAA